MEELKYSFFADITASSAVITEYKVNPWQSFLKESRALANLMWIDTILPNLFSYAFLKHPKEGSRAVTLPLCRTRCYDRNGCTDMSGAS